MFKPAFAATLVASCCVTAATETDQQHAIEHISIYANRTAVASQDVLASITVLQRDDIVARQATDLPALLAQLPGVNIARDGGRGQTSGVYVRGGNTGHTLVLVDGVRTGSATLGYKSLALLPLELIERIEIVRGPRAAWYGSDALAGVIAITTRRSTAAVALNASVGSYGQAGTDISISHTADSLSLRATAGASRADGFNVRQDLDADNDGYNQKFVKLATDYQTAIGLWSAQADVNSGFYQFDSEWGPQDEADTLNRAYVLGWQHHLGQWQHQALLSSNLDSETTFGAGTRSPFVTVREEFSYQAASTIAAAWHVLAGVNWYQEQVDKSATAYEQTSRINRGLFAGLNYDDAGLQLESAVRRDVINQYGGQNTWQLAAGYQLTPLWRVRASRGTAFKAPTFNDLYYPGYANPDLQPEKSVSDEVAVAYHNATLTTELAWFDREVTNLIQGVERAENIRLASIKGVEFSLQRQWQQFISSFAYTWLDTENRSTGDKLARRPEHTVNWRGSYQADAWSVFVTADYQSKTYQGIDWTTGGDLPQAPSHTLWGIGGSYDLSAALTLRAKIDNVFDRDYYTSHSYSTAGTNFAISISYSLQ